MLTNQEVTGSAIPTKELIRRGERIPVLGIGTREVYNAGHMAYGIAHAIDLGYRFIDTAMVFKNEIPIAAAIAFKIQQNVVKREDLFISTKVWNEHHRRHEVVQQLRESLERLELTYVDLYLMHWPIGFHNTAEPRPRGPPPRSILELYTNNVDYLETWRGLEDCVDLGLTRHIGLGNFNFPQMERILENCRIPPVVNYIEIHPYLNNVSISQSCRIRGIRTVGYFPLGINDCGLHKSCFPEPTNEDPIVMRIARRHNKTTAQIILNFLIRCLDIIPMPKASNIYRIGEYIDCFDFRLDEAEEDILGQINANRRLCAATAFADHEYYPFHRPYL